MRIAVVVSTFPPYHGGMGNVAADHARELARMRHEVTVFTPMPHREHSPTGDEPFRIVRLRPLVRWGNAALMLQILRSRGFDAVMLHYPFFGTAELFLCPILRRRFGKLNLVYHMDVVGEGMLGRVFRWHARVVLPHVLRAAERIVVSSLDYAYSGLLGSAPEHVRRKIVEIPIGVDSERFSPGDRSAARRKFSIADDSLIALFVGGLDRAHYFKGVPVLLDAWRQLHATAPHATRFLVIAGDGDLRQQYEARARGLGIADGVRFLGRVPDEDLPDLYRAADVLVLPSIDRSEAFGKVLLEAQACGVPVIASNLPGVRTAVADGEIGILVRPSDASDLAAALRQILENPKRAASLGRAARRMVEMKFSMTAVRVPLLRILE